MDVLPALVGVLVGLLGGLAVPRLIAWCGIALGLYMMAMSFRTLPAALKPHLSEWTGSRRSVLSALAVLMAGVNIFGGFMVTRRMLAMFQKS